MESPKVTLANTAVTVCFTVAMTWSWNTLVDAWTKTSTLQTSADERSLAYAREFTELQETTRRELDTLDRRLARVEMPCPGHTN